MLRYWNPKLLHLEVERYGYHFSASSYMRYLCCIYLGIAGFSFAFQLKLPYILFVMAIASIFIPKAFLLMYQNLYEEKRFEDLVAYMEQILYSFKRRAKILTALEDTSLLFHEEESSIYSAIQRAILHIRGAQTNGDIYEEAFAMIENEYGCKRLYKVHDFLRKVERLGGISDTSIEILLQDRKLWMDRVYEMQKEKKNIKIKITIGIGLSFLICAMSVWMLPKEFRITQNAISQIITAFVIIGNLSLWYVAQKKLSGSLVLSEEEMDEQTAEKNQAILNKEDNSLQRKARGMACVFLLLTIFLFWKVNLFSGILGMLVVFWCLYYPKHKYKLAKKWMRKEVEKKFPEWLMSVSLQLQTDNVHVSLEKSVSDAPQILQPELTELLRGIEQNPGSLQPYINFMRGIDLPEIVSAMKILYSMAEFGAEEMGKQIDMLVQRNAILMDKAERLRQEDILAGVGFLVLLPMVTGVIKMLIDLVLVIFHILSLVNTV